MVIENYIKIMNNKYLKIHSIILFNLIFFLQENSFPNLCKSNLKKIRNNLQVYLITSQTIRNFKIN